jgi:hypothetical protein
VKAAEAINMSTKTTQSVFFPASPTNSWIGVSGRTDGIGATWLGLVGECVAVGSGKSCDVFFKTSSNWSTIMMAVG